MKKYYKKNKGVIWFLSIIIIIVAVVVVGRLTRTPGELDAFAKCIDDSGAKFYGASWCSFCNDQKDLFGSSERYLPYVECSTPSNSVNPICRNENIEGYPTWIFGDGTRDSGMQSLEDLAEKTNCELPA